MKEHLSAGADTAVEDQMILRDPAYEPRTKRRGGGLLVEQA